MPAPQFLNHLWWSSRPPDTPSCQAVCFGQAVDADYAFIHSPETRCLVACKLRAAIHFISVQPCSRFFADVYDPSHLFMRKNAARWIVGIHNGNQLGLWASQRLQFVYIQQPVVLRAKMRLLP